MVVVVVVMGGVKEEWRCCVVQTTTRPVNPGQLMTKPKLTKKYKLQFIKVKPNLVLSRKFF